MPALNTTLRLLGPHKQSGRLTIALLVLLAVCLFSLPVEAQTSTYVFLPDQSTVVQTGGIAGVHEIYGIEGQFQLTVDFDAGIASFDKVDANLTEPSGFLYTQSLGVLFNMTELAGTVINDTAIQFKGKTSDDTNTDILINLTFTGNSVHLTGETIPPPGSADMFVYELDALASKKYAGGTGEPNDPYQIATAEDLMLLIDSPEDYDKHFVLTADIDLDPNLPGCKVFDRAVIAPDTNDVNDGFQGTPFTGVFDGNDHTISNLTIEGASYLGLFGQLGAEGEISNLCLEAVDVNGTGDYVGGLVGYLSNGSISGCYVQEGSVSADKYVGGLVGGTIPTSFLSYITNLQIRQCYAEACVSGTENVGGLIGFYEGHVHPAFQDHYELSDCYAIGVVSGTEAIGGLAGRINYGTISNCYSSARVEGNATFGGLIGTNSEGTITDSFWDIETSGQIDSAGGTGKTTAEMQTAGTFLEAGWDFVDETANGTEDIWDICEGTNYPRLVWQIPVGDFVCPDGISIEDFLFFVEHWRDDNCDLSNDYCQGTDLDESGTVDASDLEIFFDIWLD